MDAIYKSLSDPNFIFAALVGVAVFATIFTVMMPMLGGSGLQARMKNVAIERDHIRARERARLAMDSDKRRRSGSIKQQTQKPGIKALVERLDLKKALADENTLTSLRNAGYRGQNPLFMFLFLRFVLPFIAFIGAATYIFGLGKMAEHSTAMKVFIR